MTDGTYTGQSGYDRNEMFAIGAAAGALVATAVQEIIDRRRKKSPLERVTAAAGEGSKYVGELTEQASDYLADLSKQGRKATRKQTKRARKQTASLKKAAAGALGAVAASNVVEQALELAEAARHTSLTSKATQKKARKWWASASEGALEYVDAARESVADADIGGKAREAANSALDAASSARGRLDDVHFADRARDVASTARERLEDVHLTDRAREFATTATSALKEAAGTTSSTLKDAAGTASGTFKDVAETARERLSEAELGPKAREYAGVAAETVKDYSVKAQKVAKTGAEKLGESAAMVAESTAESAKDIRKGVKKSVKRTRRRMTWGIRAFIVGLAFGLLSAPQSGQRTRDMLQGFVEDLLDLVMPDESMGGAVAS